MRIAAFRIENFRNIKLAECPNVPDFVVICGGNGSGKSALLQALMTAKEHVAGYGQFRFDDRAVSADSDFALINLKIELSPEECAFAVQRFGTSCPGVGEVQVRIEKGGRASMTKNTIGTGLRLSLLDAGRGHGWLFRLYRGLQTAAPPAVDKLGLWDPER
jgi:recombinational DNA repair ATPase RecF